jgi:hypothetical protein
MKGIMTALGMTLALAIFADSCLAQCYEGYVDVLSCKVKPEKRSDFDTVVKKMADANRRYKGDTFLTSQVEYGDQNTVTFSSGRENYAAIEKGLAAFETAVKEAFGPAAGQLEKEFNACLVSSHAEIRKRRADLSINLPKDMSALWKTIGESRWVRTAAYHIRPGHLDDFETEVKAIKEGVEKGDPQGPMSLVSQAIAGNHGAVFYITSFRKSLADFDKAPPPLKQLLGQEGYQQYQKANAENVQLFESSLSRFLPELSNPPKEIADASVDFWTPKPAVKNKPTPKPAAGSKTGD